MLFILINLIKTTNGVPPDLTYIVKTNESGYINPLCIGDGDVLTSAVTWIYPIPDIFEKLPTIVSTYAPQRNIEYSCSFGKLKKCNNIWQTNGWQNSNFDTYNFIPIIDSRWENFPTYLTSNSTKEYNIRVDIPNTFEIGFSIRASRNAEIFVCEGWNPKTYACYYLNIGGLDNKQSFLRKYKNGFHDKFTKNDTKLVKFKSEFNMLSEDEWKTYSLSLKNNGVIILKDVFNNTTLLNYNDKVVLKPINFIVRSKNERALWKIHKNDFMFTNKTGILKFGPEIELYGNELCISLYILICTQCRINFFIKNNKGKEMLKEITNNGDTVWVEVKLQKHNVYEKFIQVYVETDYLNITKKKHGFWAIDDVRVCIPNELKITYLSINMTFNDFQQSHVTCQSLKHSNWRPIHQISSKSSVGEVVCNTSTSTSIKLVWKSTSEDKNFDEHSIIQYEGVDICKYDKDRNTSMLTNNLRRKSQGFVIDKNNEIEIKDLVPYTLYNISFWNVVDGTKKLFEMNTLSTDIPTKEELPRLIKMSTSDTINEIIWNKPKCNVTYGPIIYQLYVKNENGNDSRYYIDVMTKYKFENLQPFTNYTLEITSARQIENLNNTKLSIKTIHNFTTKAGIAPKVENLELYSTDKWSASLRFDIPKLPGGIPKLVQIRWCHPLFLSGCLFEIHNLTKCALWDFKYCNNVTSLVKGNKYQFSVAIKNENTFSYGTEESLNGTAEERVPGKPSNISYKMIDCNKLNGDCNLNITWMHPFNQNATITMFDVILNETSYTFVGDTLKTIHEIVKVKDKAYQRMYHCIVKYIIINTPYKLFVRAVNDEYKGDFEEMLIKTDSMENYVDQTPEFVECTNETMKFKLPKLSRRLRSSTLIVIVQNYDNNKQHMINDIVKLEMFGNRYKLCNEFGDTWVAKAINLSTTDSQLVVVGDRSLSYIPQLKKNILNKSLKPNTEYCFTFVVINEHDSSETITVYHSKHLFTQRNTHAEKQEDNSDEAVNAAVYVVPIIFIIGLGIAAIWFARKHFTKRSILNDEHIYESMPFDDYLPDAVSNENYDRLIHK